MRRLLLVMTASLAFSIGSLLSFTWQTLGTNEVDVPPVENSLGPCGVITSQAPG